MSKTEEQRHKETFEEKKTPWYKRAIVPWLVIFTVAVFVAGTVFGWSQRSDFSNEVKNEVRSIQQVSKSQQ